MPETISTEKLENDANEIIYNIIKDGRSFKPRCYEVTRLLSPELIRRGYPDVEIMDGTVIYDIGFLGLDDTKIADEFLDESASGIHTLPIRHSWCDMGEIVVDFNRSIRHFYGSDRILIVRRKDSLKDKVWYNPDGKEFRLFGKSYIYIPPFYVIKLRI